MTLTEHTRTPWRAFAAGIEAGLPFNPDFNGPSQEGIGVYQITTKSGRRMSAARAFLQFNRPADPPERQYTDREAAKLTLVEMTKRTDLKDLPEMKQAEIELGKL